MRYAVEGKGKGGETYSCDKVQMVFRLRYTTAQELLDALACSVWIEFDHWESRRPGTYRNQFSIKLDGERSYWLGVGLNEYGKSRQGDNAKLEFNPNKVWPCRSLLWLLKMLRQRMRLLDGCAVKAWDLAVDIPAPREDFELVRDARMYEEQTHSASNRTQYVGARNQPGRCKLYNKQLESDLPEPLTRLEVTVEGLAGAPEVAAIWPRVYRRTGFQTGMDIARLHDTDRFIFATLLREPDRLRELGRRKAEKMRALLEAAGYVLEFDPTAYKPVRAWVERLENGEHQPGPDVPAWEWSGWEDGAAPIVGGRDPFAKEVQNT